MSGTECCVCSKGNLDQLLRKELFSSGVFKHWKRSLREVIESQALTISFKRTGEVVTLVPDSALEEERISDLPKFPLCPSSRCLQKKKC